MAGFKAGNLIIEGSKAVVIRDPVANYDATMTYDGTSIIFNRPLDAPGLGTGGGVTDHGALTGLAGDDHTQYLRTDGSRVMTGALQFQNGGSADEVTTLSDSSSTTVLMTSSAIQDAITAGVESGESASADTLYGYDPTRYIQNNSIAHHTLTGGLSGFSGLTLERTDTIYDNVSGGNDFSRISRMQNSNIALVRERSGGNLYFEVYDSSASLIVSQDMGTTEGNASVIARPDGYVGVLCGNTSNNGSTLYLLDSNGTTINSVSVYGFGVGSENRHMAMMEDGGFVTMTAAFGSYRIATYDQNLTEIATAGAAGISQEDLITTFANGNIAIGYVDQGPYTLYYLYDRELNTLDTLQVGTSGGGSAIGTVDSRMIATQDQLYVIDENFNIVNTKDIGEGSFLDFVGTLSNNVIVAHSTNSGKIYLIDSDLNILYEGPHDTANAIACSTNFGNGKLLIYEYVDATNKNFRVYQLDPAFNQIQLATGPSINEISTSADSSSTTVLMTSSAIQNAIASGGGGGGGLFTEDANDNIVGGTGAGSSLTTATYNFLAGINAGAATTEADENVFVGRNAGLSITTQEGNVALGSYALSEATSTENVAVGFSAARYGQQFSNVAIGYNAMLGVSATSSVSNCVAVGAGALQDVTTCQLNVAIGDLAAFDVTTGSFNTALGCSALRYNRTGNNNTMVGYRAGGTSAGTAIADNTMVGYNSGANLGSGSGNVSVGSEALRILNSGSQNVGIGENAADRLNVGNYNVCIGAQAGFGILSENYSNNVIIGYQAGYSITTSNNTLIGHQAGYSLTTGSDNVFIGYQAGYNIDTTSNLLIIANNSSESLIEGDFSGRTVTINGDLYVESIFVDSTTVYIGSTALTEASPGTILINDQPVGGTTFLGLIDTPTGFEFGKYLKSGLNAASWETLDVGDNWYYGNGTPASDLADKYDYYLDVDTGDIYRKDNITYGEDQCTGGTPTAESVNATATADRAFDDDTGTNWASELKSFPADDTWIQYQFTSPKQIERIRMYPRGGIYLSRMPRDFQFLASNTGDFNGEEVTLDSYTDQTFPSATWYTYDFVNEGSYTYYRIYITDCAESYVNISEIEMKQIDSANWTNPFTLTDVVTPIAQQEVASGAISGLNTITENYTLQESDSTSTIIVDSTNNITITVPTDASAGIPDGFNCAILRRGTGEVTVTGDTGVTVGSPDGATDLRVQWSTATLLKIDTNVWALSGDIQ